MGGDQKSRKKEEVLLTVEIGENQKKKKARQQMSII